MTFLLTHDAKWYRVIIFALLFMVVPLLLNYAAVHLSEREDFFEYQRTEVPAGTVDEGDSIIRVFSYAEIYKDVPLRFQDILRCRDADSTTFEFTDSNETTAIAKAGKLPKIEFNDRGEEVAVAWRFTVDANLKKGDVCRLDSKITAILGYGVEHTQEVTSNTFVIQ